MSGELFQDMVGPLFIGLEIRLQVIGEIKQFEDSKEDNEFDQEDLPQRPTQSHTLEPISIKVVDIS